MEIADWMTPEVRISIADKGPPIPHSPDVESVRGRMSHRSIIWLGQDPTIIPLRTYGPNVGDDKNGIGFTMGFNMGFITWIHMGI